MDLKCYYHTGNTYTGRCMKLFNIFPDIHQFQRRLLEEIVCLPCDIAKENLNPMEPSLCISRCPLELNNVEIRGKIAQQSLEISHYAIRSVDESTAKTDAYFVNRKSDLFPAL